MRVFERLDPQCFRGLFCAQPLTTGDCSLFLKLDILCTLDFVAGGGCLLLDLFIGRLRSEAEQLLVLLTLRRGH